MDRVLERNLRILVYVNNTMKSLNLKAMEIDENEIDLTLSFRDYESLVVHQSLDIMVELKSLLYCCKAV